MQIKFMKATEVNIAEIKAFCDFWLRGYGVAEGIKGAGNDYFVPLKRHRAFLCKYDVRIALVQDCVVGWAVLSRHNVLIHLLVNPTFRKQGIGKKLVQLLNPEIIRSKVDQVAGNPVKFYAKLGYKPNGAELIGKKKNIQLLHKSIRKRKRKLSTSPA